MTENKKTRAEEILPVILEIGTELDIQREIAEFREHRNRGQIDGLSSCIELIKAYGELDENTSILIADILHRIEKYKQNVSLDLLKTIEKKDTLKEVVKSMEDRVNSLKNPRVPVRPEEVIADLNERKRSKVKKEVVE